MAFQPETSGTFPSVYQWEVTDPVDGGLGAVANLPLVQLTARTRYLADQTAALQAAVALLAPINSPILTGIPQAPTPALDAAATQIATVAFVREMQGGVLGVNMPGNYALTVAQAGYGILNVMGLLAPSYLLFPVESGRWIVFNNSNFSLFCRLSPGGSTVTIQAGRVQTVWADGANMLGAHTDYDSINITGTPIVNTAPDRDRTTQIANTAWVGREIAEDLVAYAPLANPAFSGAPSTPSPPPGDDTTRIPNTAWVYGALFAELSLFAPLANPTLTGIPSAPTPALDAAGTQIATAAFVREMQGGVIGINMAAGNYALTVAQAGYGLIVATALAAPSYLLFPLTGRWTVLNNSGFLLYCRLIPGGSVVAIQAGRVQTIWTDGANMFGAHTDYDSINITGTPIVSTAPDRDRTTQIANTAWVGREIAEDLGPVGLQFTRRASFGPSNTSWIAPAGVTLAHVKGQAGGGGGGGSYGALSGGAGGAGGGNFDTIISVVPGTSYAVVVGASGVGGDGSPGAGTAGGATSFGATFIAYGGAGGGAGNGSCVATLGAGGAAVGDGGTNTICRSGVGGGTGFPIGTEAVVCGSGGAAGSRAAGPTLNVSGQGSGAAFPGCGGNGGALGHGGGSGGQGELIIEY